MDIIRNNFQYITTDNHGDNKARSYCSSRIDRNGEQRREIFINPEGRIGDISAAIHELGHSLSQCFIQCRGSKDKNMSEVAPVILDAISNYYLSNRMPHLKSNFNTHAIHTQVQNVIKARETLLDGLVIKLMMNELTLDDIKAKYGNIFLRNTNVLKRCLENIETYNFTNMYEKRYLLPQAIALNVLDIYKKQPDEAVKLFKEILKNDSEWTIDQTLKYLKINSKEELIDNYVNKYNVCMNNMLNTQALFV